MLGRNIKEEIDKRNTENKQKFVKYVRTEVLQNIGLTNGGKCINEDIKMPPSPFRMVSATTIAADNSRHRKLYKTEGP